MVRSLPRVVFFEVVVRVQVQLQVQVQVQVRVRVRVRVRFQFRVQVQVQDVTQLANLPSAMVCRLQDSKGIVPGV